MSKFLCLRYSVPNHSGFWSTFFSRRYFLRIAASSIPGVIQGLLFPQLEMFFFLWMGQCSLKTESNVLWSRSSASSLINTGFQLISGNESLKIDKFS